MAKTWTVNEAYNAIKANDSEGIADFGKRFPLATTALAKAGVNAGLDVLMGAMPDRVTMRILEMQLKEGVNISEDADEADEVEEVEEEKPVKTEKKAKADKKADKTEKKSEEKPKRGKAAKKAEPVEEVEEDEEEVEEDDTPDYKSMSAVELFKLCKKRGIKVEMKQKSSVYIKALQDADKAANEADGDADDEDEWDI